MINHSPPLHPRVRQAGKQLFHFSLASFRLVRVPVLQAGERNKNTPLNQITDYKKAFSPPQYLFGKAFVLLSKSGFSVMPVNSGFFSPLLTIKSIKLYHLAQARW